MSTVGHLYKRLGSEKSSSCIEIYVITGNGQTIANWNENNGWKWNNESTNIVN